jgi:hypothetical protein
MGLTIHYTLTLPAKTTVPDVKQKLGTLRQACLDIPFQEVSEILEFKGEECDPDRLERGHPLRWFLCQADSHVYFQIASNGKPMAVQQLQDGCYSRTVLPEHVIGFSTYPGNGSEEANIGLSRFPRSVIVKNKQSGKNHRLPIADGGGWKWHSFCKTQYANEHGLENFLRCHLSVVAMLDAAKRIGFDVVVNDEGHYWEKRDVHALVREIGEWDQMIAAFGGSLKDAAGVAGMTIESPIFNRKDFETLELKGQSQLPPSWNQALQSLIKETAAVTSEKPGN